jgi:hypothetical protein
MARVQLAGKVFQNTLNFMFHIFIGKIRGDLLSRLFVKRGDTPWGSFTQFLVPGIG